LDRELKKQKMNLGNTGNFWDQHGGEILATATTIVNAATSSTKSAITHVPDSISRIYQQPQGAYALRPQTPSWLLPAGIAGMMGLAALMFLKKK
jgi:hypothetical protein